MIILAAGMGSRYGGLKQLDPMTGHGEFIPDFSVYDAKRAGFDRVVFIIKKEHEELFRQTIGNRISKQIKVDYVYQSVDMVPAGVKVPEGRVKPWGTGHALLCAKDAVGGDTLAVINADDFYGADAYRQVGAFLKSRSPEESEFCMAGYVLKNTLSENGSVSRGICQTDDSGYLTDVVERTKIYQTKDGETVFEENGRISPTDENGWVSMNFWGFTPAIFPLLEHGFAEFFEKNSGDLEKKEFYLSMCVGEAVKSGQCRVRVLPTDAKWYGVTYPEDKPAVVAAIAGLAESGAYPDGLFGED